ncbi:Ferritin [Paragonimus heterotremus]|uniref:Ferritin n=1 Tax=Paragonimus heterotremus TaxID=100268 RepID=A0A8J4SFK5_9TREM|nr:Ferritin [Paragonimus heterotremus]
MHSVRTNYTPETEKAVNKIIQLHQQAALTYDHLAATCATEEVSMPGFCKFFRLCSQRQRKLVEHWINYQTMRGGKLNVPEVKPFVQVNDFSKMDLEKIVVTALETEKTVEEYLRDMHKITRSKEEVAMGEYIEKKCTLPQLHVIKMMSNHVNGLRVSGNAYLYDRKTMLPLVKKLRYELCRREWTGNCEEMGEKKCHWRTSSGVAAFIYPF